MRPASLPDAYLLCLIGLMWAVERLDSPQAKRAAIAMAAGAAFALRRQKRRRALAGLQAAFGSALSPAQRLEILRAASFAFWQEAFSCVMLSAEQAALAQARVIGLERLRAALQAGKGVILVESSAFGQRWNAKVLLHQHGIAAHQVHVDTHLQGIQGGPPSVAQQRLIRPFFDRREIKFLAQIVRLPNSPALAYTRRLLGILQRNGVICAAGDGVTGHKLIELPFLGRARQFTTGLVSLARLSGAPLLPMFCVLAEDNRLELTIHPALDLSGSDAERSQAAGMAHYAQVLEARIRRSPGQYRNWHSVAAA